MSFGRRSALQRMQSVKLHGVLHTTADIQVRHLAAYGLPHAVSLTVLDQESQYTYMVVLIPVLQNPLYSVRTKWHLQSLLPQ